MAGGAGGLGVGCVIVLPSKHNVLYVPQHTARGERDADRRGLGWPAAGTTAHLLPHEVSPQVGAESARSLWESKIELGEDFFHEIIRCPIPIDLNTLRAMKRSPLGLGLYLWLTYRTFGLTRPLRLTWPLLYRQFGVDPARSNDKFTVRNFREDCLRELKKQKDAWPDLHYQTVKGARQAGTELTAAFRWIQKKERSLNGQI